MRDFITARGHAAVQPRFVAEVTLHHIDGRVFNIRDNFPHLDGGGFATTSIYRQVLGKDEKVLPILAAQGFRLAGNWKTNRRTTLAVIERV